MRHFIIKQNYKVYRAINKIIIRSLTRLTRLCQDIPFSVYHLDSEHFILSGETQLRLCKYLNIAINLKLYGYYKILVNYVMYMW